MKKEIIEPEEVTELDLAREEIITPAKKEERGRTVIGTLNVFMQPSGGQQRNEAPQLPAPPRTGRMLRLVFLAGVAIAGVAGFIFFGIPSLRSFLERPPLTIALTLPPKATQYEVFEGSVTVKNVSSKTLEEISVVPVFPKSFELSESLPLLKDGTWTILSLTEGKEESLTFSGKIVGGEEIVTFAAEASGKNNDQEVSFGKAEKKLPAQLSTFLFEQLVNGTKEAVVNLGDPLTFRFRLQNLGSKNIENVQLEVELLGALADQKNLEVPQGKLSGRTILFDPSTLPLFKKILPNSEAVVEVKTRVLPHVPDTLRVSADPPTVTSKAKISYVLEGEQLLLTDVKEAKVSSDVALLAQVRYFSPEGEQIGRGPLPPEVGLKTTYWISFRVGNILNSLENSVLKFKLPSTELEWTGRATVSQGSELLFDPFSKEVTWIAGDVPANRSFNLTPPSGSFEVAVVPLPESRGQIPLLLQEITLSARDRFTGTIVEKAFGGVDADLRFDERGRLQGIRVK